jgi:hypothetical protein
MNIQQEENYFKKSNKINLQLSIGNKTTFNSQFLNLSYLVISELKQVIILEFYFLSIIIILWIYLKLQLDETVCYFDLQIYIFLKNGKNKSEVVYHRQNREICDLEISETSFSVLVMFISVVNYSERETKICQIIFCLCLPHQLFCYIHCWYLRNH